MSKLTLYPYQEEGVAWLTESDRANQYLADEMGLGKTVQAIEAMKRLGVTRPLVICPASAVSNWRLEWRTWGSAGRLGITSYGRLIRHYRKIRKGGWDLVILDEAHYVKTPSAKRARHALTIASEAPMAWLLSGTPIPNHTGELWAPIKYLWREFPARFGITTSAQWLDAFAKTRPTRYGAQPYAVKNAHLLKPFLNDIMLRRKWQEVGLDLPPLRVDTQFLPHDSAFADRLAEMVAGVGIDYVMEAQSDDPHVSRLRHFLGMYKAEKVATILVQEIRDQQYDKIVVLAHHHDTLDMLALRFSEAGINHVGFRGSASSTQRQRAIDQFLRQGRENRVQQHDRQPKGRPMLGQFRQTLGHQRVGQTERQHGIPQGEDQNKPPLIRNRVVQQFTHREAGRERQKQIGHNAKGN